jgi:hypothetical protein
LTINGVPVSTVLDVEQKVQRARQTGLLKATCEFATVGSHSAHPIEGLLQLYYDQINVIAVHLKDFSLHSTTPVVQTDQADNVDTSCPMGSPSSVPSSIPHSQPSITTTGNVVPFPQDEQGQHFTWKQIKKRPDLSEWKEK